MRSVALRHCITVYKLNHPHSLSVVKMSLGVAPEIHINVYPAIEASNFVGALKDKVAFVTGAGQCLSCSEIRPVDYNEIALAGRGIGRAIALALHKPVPTLLCSRAPSLSSTRSQRSLGQSSAGSTRFRCGRQWTMEPSQKHLLRPKKNLGSSTLSWRTPGTHSASIYIH